MRCDALIIGGGPAGAACAIMLAALGRSVIVLEKTRFPRRKVCGEFVAGSGIAQLNALGLAERFDAAAGPQVRRVALWIGGSAFSTALPAPYARALERETLDTLLLDEARRRGAQVLQPMAALALERTQEGFLCHAAERRGAPAMRIHAKAAIRACGSWEPPGELLGFQAHFRDADLPPSTIALIAFRGGYAGLVARAGGRATFASCIRRDELERIRAAGMPAGEAVLACATETSRHLRNALERAVREGAWLAAGPLHPGTRALYRDGVFAVGNAAGEAHPIVGEGIAMALGAAALLCQPLAQALAGRYTKEDEEHVALLYANAWRRAFSRRLWAAACFARLAMFPPSLRLLARGPGVLSVAARLSGK